MAASTDGEAARFEPGEGHDTTIIVNGDARSVPSTTSLLSALRAHFGLTGAKPGCGEGACGSCTVLLDGKPVRACRQSVAGLDGTHVTTIEGLASGDTLHPVQQAFVDVGAMQCGYCTPGMVLSVTALLDREPDPSDEAVTEALTGNLCRCGCYSRIRKAVHRARELTSEPSLGDPMAATAASYSFGAPDPLSPSLRPARPWDMTDPKACEWFDVLGDGLVVVLPPRTPAPGTWTTGGGAWLHVAADGPVTAFTGKVDVGQDNRTALRLLVAEETGTPLSDVRLAMGDTDLCPYDMGTFGSQSMPSAGGALRRVAAHARALMPVAAGARRVEIVGGDAPVVPSTEWLTVGKGHMPAAAVDAVTGWRRFVTDLTLPGLRHAAVLRPPVPGATLRRLDTTAVEGRDDVVVVHTPEVIGVVGIDPTVARLALADLRSEWDVPAAPSEEHLGAYLRSHPAEELDGWGGPFHHEEGDAEGALETAAVRLQATYTTAYIAPAALETRAALAVWDGDGRLTVWTGTQTPFPVRAQVAAAVGLGEHEVRVIVPPTGGGFGGKHAGGVAVEAAVLAREIGHPVRVAWTRHEEFTAGTLRPAAVIDVAAGATSDGEMTAWTFTNFNSGQAAISTPYRVANLRIDYRPCLSPLLQGSYRALAATANNFARESQIDELAHLLGRDPLEFRLRNVTDDRLATVLQAAAERFGWTAAGAGSGRGIACGLEKGGHVATAAQVRIHPDGHLQVVRLVMAYECGAVVNPSTVINQIEGAAVMALGGAMFEAIHFTSGAITNGTFSDYRAPRIGDVPVIEVVLLDRPDLPSAGAGETPMMAVAPAVANAVFDAVGRRLRSLPLVLDNMAEGD
ncbi:MAG: molybdopterin cofactor-binding domain-containing protein [Acidimicrobiales bacterium]|jgi:isoquinoline 1-oxidoreductase